VALGVSIGWILGTRLIAAAIVVWLRKIYLRLKIKWLYPAVNLKIEEKKIR